MSPFVMVILWHQIGFTVDFQTLEACQAMQKQLQIQTVAGGAISCGARGEPVQAFEVRRYRPTYTKLSKVRRIRHSYWARRGE